MDAAQNPPEHDQSVMIALLPIDSSWCQIELPHMTLVYAGKISGLNPGDFNEMAKDAASLAAMNRPLALEVFRKEQFGDWSEAPADVVDVYRLRPKPELLGMRNTVKRWNKSEYDFNPHVTIGPAGVVTDFQPSVIAFDRIGVFWGRDQELVFNFKV
jgi:2'-5' RNA ligase